MRASSRSRGYWRRHVREAVRFADGLRRSPRCGPTAFIEIGPHPTLLAFASAVVRRRRRRRCRRRCARAAPTGSSCSRRSRRCTWRARRSTGAAWTRAAARASSTCRPIRSSASATGSAHASASQRPARARNGPSAARHAAAQCGAASASSSPASSADAPAFVRQHRVQDRVVHAGHGLPRHACCARPASSWGPIACVSRT